MVLRVPALWFLLAVSATAFFTYGIPGNKWFKDWFGYIAGWSIFGPIYLAIIYFGLYIIFIGEYKCKKCNMEIFKGVNFCKYCGQKQIPV